MRFGRPSSRAVCLTLLLAVGCRRPTSVGSQPSDATVDALPTLASIESSDLAPTQIQPTGKRESLERWSGGVLEGRARYYHPNGQLYGVIEYTRGRKTGSHLLYRDDGTPEQSLSYRDGKLNGLCRWFDDCGRVTVEAMYEDDRVKWKRAISPSGADAAVGPRGPVSATGVADLQLAVAEGKVATTRQLLDAGADPNALTRDGTPIGHWLGSGRGYTDEDLLLVAQLLAEHQCTFEEPATSKGVDVVANLASRHVPKTLAFLASRRVSADYTKALRAVARADDLESIKVLLDAGADVLAGDALSSALMDAAAAGRAPTVTLMLSHVTDLTSPKVAAAYRAALMGQRTAAAQAFAAAGVPAPAPAAVTLRPPCEGRELTADQADLMRRAGLGDAVRAGRCKFIQECGGMILVDCDSAADGPAYYIDTATSKAVATCGGACMAGCTDCPPAGWSCSCAR